MRTFCLFILTCLLPFSANSQLLDNSSLNGKYYFVHILAQVSGGTASPRKLYYAKIESGSTGLQAERALPDGQRSGLE